MSGSMKLISHSVVRWSANLVAKSLALLSVFLLGRSGAATAPHVETTSGYLPTYTIGQELGGQMSYVQIGHKDGEDWPRPWPE